MIAVNQECDSKNFTTELDELDEVTEKAGPRGDPVDRPYFKHPGAKAGGEPPARPYP